MATLFLEGDISKLTGVVELDPSRLKVGVKFPGKLTCTLLDAEGHPFARVELSWAELKALLDTLKAMVPQGILER